MMTAEKFEFVPTQKAAAQQSILWWSKHGEPMLETAAPVVIETIAMDKPDCPDGDQRVFFYKDIQKVAGGDIVATSWFSAPNGITGTITDRWTMESNTASTLRRSVSIQSSPPAAGLRVGLHLQPAFPEGLAFKDLEYYAPNACYNLNDLNEDGLCDYLDSQSLSYREDRLNALSVLAFHRARGFALALSRLDVPKYDDEPVRSCGQRCILQDTDVGSLGFHPVPGAPNGAALAAYYPFVERPRCNALLVQNRTSWGAFRPVSSGDSYSIAYAVRMYHSSSPHDALWSLIKRQMAVLRPKPVSLGRHPSEVSRLRLEALSKYFMEDSAGGAGFVTNCHPQDGRQLANIIQYGFTGQNIMNAANLLRAPPEWSFDKREATKVIEFYVSSALQSPYGFTYGLYNLDQQRHDSWWTGILLPLAYARPGEDLERLMGQVYTHRQSIIESLSQSHGVYTRCVLEETEALLQLYKTVREPPDRWLEVAVRFGDFLIRAQESDGTWRRAYSMDGRPLTEPREWFGQTFYQQRSSTATVIPLLLELSEITRKDCYRSAAIRAGRFVRTHFVDKVRHNGGIHDSIYAKPQLIDHESIYFCCRALLSLYEKTNSDLFRRGAIHAAQLSASWILLWDIPLPPESTLARRGFRSTGWAGCDAPGAGYVHPMGIIATPDLVRVAQMTGDATFLDIAELCFMASNENVGREWGYAHEGMQEEGLLLSPWFLDDPMFARGTGFGDRRKGEGNKTCLPWISAVTVWAADELRRRFGTLDFAELRRTLISSPAILSAETLPKTLGMPAATSDETMRKATSTASVDTSRAINVEA